MRKRRKLLIVLALIAPISIALIALCFAPSGRPVNEPQYQGRYLSEWLGDPCVWSPDVEFADEAGKQAVRAIGTNGLPHYLEWLRYEPGKLRLTVSHSWMHRWGRNIPAYSNWLNPPEQWRAHYGFRGFEILGADAVSVIPELTIMLNDTTKPYTWQRAMGALCAIGPQSIPVFKATFADTNRTERWKIASMLRYLGNNGHSNTCLPILAEALYDHDSEVREEATKALEKWAPHLLTNAPAN